MSQKKIVSIFIFCSLILAAAIFQKKVDAPVKTTYSGSTMGTTFSVVYVNTSSHEDAYVNNLINQSIELVNDQMSTYKSESNLSEFNRLPVNSCYEFPDDTYQVLEMAQEISEITEGSFDVTIGPLVNLWGFGPTYKPEVVPSDEEINEIRSTKVGYQSLVLKGDNTACKLKPIYVDLSAIAKGYAVDLAANALDSLSIHDYLVEIGGELKAKGIKPNKDHWKVAVEDPDNELGHSVHKVLELKDLGIATSGDYRNYYEVDGKRYSHTVDPSTGKPIEHSLASISVLHKSVAYADAIATGFGVMGAERAQALAKKEGLAIYMIVKNSETFSIISTKEFNQYLLD